jgi:hypothetical protein
MNAVQILFAEHAFSKPIRLARRFEALERDESRIFLPVMPDGVWLGSPNWMPTGFFCRPQLTCPIGLSYQ